jgi:hypothetical protein
VWLQEVPAGSELLISYLGSQPTKDNTALMKDYGFVLPGNINDSIAFTPVGEVQDRLVLLPAWRKWLAC